MIDKTVTWLNLLIGGFIAGAVVCAVGLLVSVAAHFGWMRPLNSGDLLTVYLAVALFTSATRIKGQVAAEAARHVVMLEADRLALEERRARLAPAQPPPAAAAPLPARDTAAHVAAHWDVFWRLLAQAGDAYGWTQANLTTEGTPTKVMSEQAWNYVVPMLIAAGWLAGGKVGRATKWAPKRSLAAFMAREAWKALPHPEQEPPTIALPPYTLQHHNSATTLDGVGRMVE